MLRCWSILLVSLAAATFPGRAGGSLPEGPPLYLALLIQDDLSAAVGSDLEAYRRFVAGLPPGTRVLVAYARAGSPEIRQDFSSEREEVVAQIRPPAGTAGSAPGSLYQAVREVLKLFPQEGKGRKGLILVADGRDHQFDLAGEAPASNPILRSTVRLAQERKVQIYTIFAPPAVPAGESEIALGQDGLRYLARQTGGESYFSGTSYISASPYLERIREELSRPAP